MRIAMIGSRGIPAGSGGVERVTEELTNELAARGHDVIVYSRPWYVRGLPAPPAGRRILTPGLGGKHLDTITHTATAAFDVLRRDVDVVHVHSPGPAVMSWLPAAAGLPIVFTVHAPDWHRDKWSPFARAVLRAGLACGMHVAAAVTAVGRELADDLAERFARPVRWVPNGVRPALPRPPDGLAQWRLSPERYILYVGRIVPEKRLDVLIHAWRQAGVPVPLVVAGPFHETAYGRRCFRDAPGVRFLGPVRGEALAVLYSHAAVVVQPSALEGMSLVLLEAAAFRRCIIAANIPANLNTMGRSIVYFPVDNVAELAEAIRRYVRMEDLRRDLGRQARDHVASTFHWSAVADRMEEVYDTVAVCRRCGTFHDHRSRHSVRARVAGPDLG